MSTEVSTPSSSSQGGSLTKEERIDYQKNSSHFAGVRFIFECGRKLKTTVTTIAIATTYYHRFYNIVEKDNYDIYTIGTTCIYIASKVTNDDLKVRDIINVAWESLHGDVVSMDPYFSFRDSMMFTELLIMRVLGFKLEVDLPHKYILHYITALKDWLGDEVFETIPITRTAWAIVQDSFHSSLCIKYSPQLIAASSLHLALQVYGVIVPGCDELSDKPWYGVLNADCTTANVWEVTTLIIKTYEAEKDLTLLEDKKID